MAISGKLWSFFSKRSSTDAKPEHVHGPECGHSASKPEAHAAPAAAGGPTSLGLGGIRHIIAVASGKGGVGKSTVAMNLALALQARGQRVGLMDADIYGPSQPKMLGAPHARAAGSGSELRPVLHNGIQFISMGVLLDSDGPVVWRAPMAMKVIQQFLSGTHWGVLDTLIIDLPPGTGDVQLTLAQQAQLTGAVIVTTPQEAALNIAQKGLKMFEQVNVPILGMIENMSGFTCSHCHHETAIFKAGGGARLATELSVPFLGAIPLDPEVMGAADNGKPIVQVAPESKAARAFQSIAAQLEQSVETIGRTQKGPTPERIEVVASGALEIQWAGNGGARQVGSTTLSAYDVRVHCGCAHCVDETTGRRVLDPAKISAEIKITGIHGVGRYAIGVHFSDGHTTGIYPFRKLEEMSQLAARPAAVNL